ncbi:MAG: hypothetical protein GTN49_00905, partial [candidate division Zixibacteria bacterium]|nr:hypothetical protein [candidate division Zixibacteria bacterium]
MGQYLGLVTDGGTGALINENILVGLVRGSKVCASVDMMFDQTSTAPIKLVLGDHDGTNSQDTEFQVEPLYGELRRFTVYRDIRTGAKQVYFKIV